MGQREDEADDRCTEEGDDQAFYAPPVDAPNPSAAKTEPVAWRFMVAGVDEWEFCETDPRCETTDFSAVQPLYTHPQPSLSVGLDREAVAKIIWHRFAPSSDYNSGNALRGEYILAADAILALAARAEGYVLVPVEPTEAMVSAGMSEIDWCRDEQVQDKFRPFLKLNQDGSSYSGTSPGEDVRDAYRAMIAACLPAAPIGEAL